MNSSTLANDTFGLMFFIVLFPTIFGKIIKGIKNKKEISGLDYSNYFLQKSLMTNNEIVFYTTLKVVVGNKF